MNKNDLERYKTEEMTRRVFFCLGLGVAFVLALVDSAYAATAFSFIGGLMGGSALRKTL